MLQTTYNAWFWSEGEEAATMWGDLWKSWSNNVVGIVAKIFVGLNYRSIQQAMEHKELLNNETIGVKWVKFNRKQQNDAMNENVKQIVVRWWTKETRVSLNVKDVVCHFISPNTWEKTCYSFFARKPSTYFCL